MDGASSGASSSSAGATQSGRPPSRGKPRGPRRPRDTGRGGPQAAAPAPDTPAPVDAPTGRPVLYQDPVTGELFAPMPLSPFTLQADQVQQLPRQPAASSHHVHHFRPPRPQARATAAAHFRPSDVTPFVPDATLFVPPASQAQAPPPTEQARPARPPRQPRPPRARKPAQPEATTDAPAPAGPIASSRPPRPPRGHRKADYPATPSAAAATLDKVGTAQSQADSVSGLVGALSEKLSNGTYECMICFDRVRRDARIWSDSGSCFAVFHLRCIEKWATQPAAHAPGGWRCPGCQHVVTTGVPSQYHCFCGKVTNPGFQHFLTPHSCGDACDRKRGNDCPHPCNLPCHPGPCPPCAVLLPPRSCGCGATSYRVRCGEIDTMSSCGQTCGKPLACGRHACASLCHHGPCEPCAVTEQLACYCGAQRGRAVRCGDIDGPLDVARAEGAFNCGAVCGRPLACGNHKCSSTCHRGDCAPCPRLPSPSTPCGCGRTRPSERGLTRASCADPLLSCGQVCGKPLACGNPAHRCDAVCHDGPCETCMARVQQTCRCGSEKRSVVCGQTSHGEPFRCTRICRQLRLCGRHQCSQQCCIGNEGAHLCPLPCNKKLRCGVHTCPETCHRGHCGPCYQASFDELSCHCGRTVMYPPIPCGATLPECPHPCTRPHPCDHPVTHKCHERAECPPCNIPTLKPCACHRKIMGTVPCHKEASYCSRVCELELPCGHLCTRTCHAGACVDPNARACAQECLQRRQCGHPCRAPCHPDKPCPNVLCKESMTLMCRCGTRVERVICGFSGDAATLRRAGGLECNDACLVFERNRKLAEALQLDRAPSQPPALSPWATFPVDLFEFLSLPGVSTWAKRLEDRLEEFVSDERRPTLALEPMKPQQRRLVHELAQRYGLDSESVDEEPRRSVILRKRSLSMSLPLQRVTKVHEEGAWRKKTPVTASAFSSLRSTAAHSTTAPAAPVYKYPVNAVWLRGLPADTNAAELHDLLTALLPGVVFELVMLGDGDAAIMPQVPSRDDAGAAIEVAVADVVQKLRDLALDALGDIGVCWVTQQLEAIDYSKERFAGKRPPGPQQPHTPHVPKPPPAARPANPFEALPVDMAAVLDDFSAVPPPSTDAVPDAWDDL